MGGRFLLKKCRRYLNDDDDGKNDSIIQHRMFFIEAKRQRSLQVSLQLYTINCLELCRYTIISLVECFASMKKK